MEPGVAFLSREADRCPTRAGPRGMSEGQVNQMKIHVRFSSREESARTIAKPLTSVLQFGCGLLMLGVLYAAGAAETPGAQTLSLTLEQAIRMAQEGNPGYRSTLTAGEVAEFDFETARRKRYPRVDLFASYLGAPIEDKRLIPRTLLENLPQNEKFDSQIATVGMRARVPVYVGGRIDAEIGAAQSQRERFDFESRQTLDDLVFDVTRTFYTLLVLERIREAELASLEDLEESQRVIQQLLDVGRAARLELLRMQTRVSNVRQALIRNQSAVDTAQARLRRLLGLDDADRRSLRLVGELRYEPENPGDRQALVTQALKQRPGYRALEAELASQDQRQRIARSERRPQVNLDAVYLGAAGLDRNSSADDATLFLTFSLPIFDGGVIRSRVNRANARYRQLQQRLQDLRLQVRFEVQQSLDAIREAGERVKNTEAALAAAQEALRVEQKKLAAGKGIINDVLDAQSDALSVEVDLAKALADHRIALAALARATGRSTISITDADKQTP
ncbi:MAG: hypothetical protein BMS9Abin10_0281 [Gammaproteobacteria bacterium]|nr:MAG: hypothetical protein BMS9Abin10_0281 [Gammaproteobacteria bacterium]